MKVSPFADTLSLIPDDANDTRCEWFMLPQLVETTIHLVKGLDIGDYDLILQIFNVLLI